MIEYIIELFQNEGVMTFLRACMSLVALGVSLFIIGILASISYYIMNYFFSK